VALCCGRMYDLSVGAVVMLAGMYLLTYSMQQSPS
jgi:hypothetical protein